MDVCIDVETRGLSATKDAFVAGCIRKASGPVKVYYDVKELWEAILKIGDYCLRNGKVLNVYAHNHIYDFLCYANITDTNLRIYNDYFPMIISYHDKKKNKEYIKFLDTMALFPYSLKKLGKIVGVEKGELSQEFMDDMEKYSIKELQDMIKNNVNSMNDYLRTDTQIPLLALDMIKKKLKSEDIRIKRLYTISQVAISYIVNKLKKDSKLDEDNFWYNKERGWVHRTRYSEEIHGAYRGPKVEAFQFGYFTKKSSQMTLDIREKGVEHHSNTLSYVDINSLYPFCICNIRMPNLKTERKLKEPLKYYDKKELLGKIGVSRVLMENVSSYDLLMPVRTNTGNHYPVIGTKFVGTYTHIELRKAITCGYKIHKIEWSVVWDELGHNPFKRIYERLYILRKSGSEFDNTFYKSILNNSIGKMAQLRPQFHYVIDSIELGQAYLDNMYEIMHSKDGVYMYKKEESSIKFKHYYMPIISALVNAYARVYMFDIINKVPREDRVYTDTDSLIYKHRDGKNTSKFDIGEGLGKLKVVCEDKDGLVYGRKTYAIGDEVKISGMRKRGVTFDDFLKGEVISKKMYTLKTAPQIDDAGRFYDDKRNLFIQLDNAKKLKKMLSDQKIYIDADVQNISYFMDLLK